MRSRTEVARAGQSLTRVLVLFFLFSPYLIWWTRLPIWSVGAWDAFGPRFGYTLVQAMVSAAFALAGGCVLVRGLLAWRRPWVAEALLIAPNVIPPIFIALALINFFGLVVAVPFGFWAVVIAHALLNSGLVALALAQRLEASFAGQAEMAWVMGAPFKAFAWRVLAPQLKGELVRLAMFVLALSLTSFSLPLLLGGTRASTLDVMIYNLIRVDGRWDQALLLAFAQTACVLLFSLRLPSAVTSERRRALPRAYVAWRFGAVFVGVPAVILAAGGLGLLAQAARVGLEPVIREALLPAAMMSGALALSVGLLHLLLFLLMAWLPPHSVFEKIMNGYLGPSPAIAGFALLLWPHALPEGARLVVTLTLVAFPLLYRWQIGPALRSLRAQRTVAEVLGASPTLIWSHVVLPQTLAVGLRASALAAVWAAGDFAISSLFLAETPSLPLLIESALATYRFDQAAVLAVPLAVLSFVIYFLFARASRYVVG